MLESVVFSAKISNIELLFSPWKIFCTVRGLSSRPKPAPPCRLKPRSLLFFSRHTCTRWPGKSSNRRTMQSCFLVLNAANVRMLLFIQYNLGIHVYDLWPVSVNWVCVGPGLFVCSPSIEAVLIPPLLRTTTPKFRVLAILRTFRASQWTHSHSDVPLIDKIWSPSFIEPCWAATPEWNTLWTWEEDVHKTNDKTEINESRDFSGGSKYLLTVTGLFWSKPPATLKPSPTPGSLWRTTTCTSL